VTVTAWRICKRRYAATAFDGEGAKRFGGRLNSKGVAIVYTAESVALAALEMLVHLESADLLARYLVRSARFDDSLVSDLDRRKLPKSWRQSPTPHAVQRIGDEWIAGGRSAVLRVPSAVIPSEYNYLLNPAHPDFRHVVLGPSSPSGSTRGYSSRDGGDGPAGAARRGAMPAGFKTTARRSIRASCSGPSGLTMM